MDDIRYTRYTAARGWHAPVTPVTSVTRRHADDTHRVHDAEVAHHEEYIAEDGPQQRGRTEGAVEHGVDRRAIGAVDAKHLGGHQAEAAREAEDARNGRGGERGPRGGDGGVRERTARLRQA